VRYRVGYLISGAESGGLGSQIFDADNDADAVKKADELVAKMERQCNAEISNPFWHFQYKRTNLVRVVREEITEPVHA